MSNEGKKATPAAIQAAVAKGEALWKLICDAGMEVGLAMKVRDRDDFALLTRPEQLAVVRIGTVFQSMAHGIDDQFKGLPDVSGTISPKEEVPTDKSASPFADVETPDGEPNTAA